MMIGVGKIYRDKNQAGRLYIPKKLMNQLDFENGEQVLIEINGNEMIVTKLSGSSRHSGIESRVREEEKAGGDWS